MKKIVLFFAIAIVASGVTWAQNMLPGMNDFVSYVVEWDFNAVLTESVESRFSAQRFTSDVDDFIDPAFFNPDIGNFIFVGGHLTDITPEVSFGWARTFNNFYLGLYYGGEFLTASGDSNDDMETQSSIDWGSNLAVLFGIANMGFRLDLILNDHSSRAAYDGTLTHRRRQNGHNSIALGWGTSMFSNINLTPWARVGFKFPMSETTTNNLDTLPPTLEMTVSSEAQLAFQVGALYELDDVNSFIGELNFTYQFPRRWSGDTNYLHPSATPGLGDGPEPFSEGGGLKIDLLASYQRILRIGERTTLRIRPRLNVDFISAALTSENFPGSALDADFPRANWFNVSTSLDVGAQYQFEKIAIYTGFSLNLLGFRNLSFSGGDDAYQTDISQWNISGISWRNTIWGGTMSDPVLVFGLTFTPIENLVIGAGFAQLINLNLRNMVVGNVPNPDNRTLTNILGTSFQLTASYRF